MIASCAALPAFADSIPEAVSQLRDRDHRVRVQAETVLVKAGPKAVRDLVTEMGAGSRQRRVALAVLAKVGKRAVPELIGLLKEPELRQGAGEALFQVAGPDSRGEAPALLACLKDPDLKHYCGQALAKVVDRKSKALVPGLMEALRSRDKDVRLYAALALGRIGRKAKAAAPALEEAAKDREPEVSRTAAEALKKIQS